MIKCKPPDNWWVKVADLGLSKRAEGIVASTTVRGNESFIAPETRGFPFIGDPTLANPFAADMWSLGELIFRALTGRATFDDPRQLVEYQKTGTGFPNNLLRDVHASPAAESVVLSLMSANPSARMTAADTLRHPWMTLHADTAPESPPQPMTSPRPSAFPFLGDIAEPSGQWTATMPHRGPPKPQLTTRTSNAPTSRTVRPSPSPAGDRAPSREATTETTRGVFRNGTPGPAETPNKYFDYGQPGPAQNQEHITSPSWQPFHDPWTTSYHSNQAPARPATRANFRPYASPEMNPRRPTEQPEFSLPPDYYASPMDPPSRQQTGTPWAPRPTVSYAPPIEDPRPRRYPPKILTPNIERPVVGETLDKNDAFMKQRRPERRGESVSRPPIIEVAQGTRPARTRRPSSPHTGRLGVPGGGATGPQSNQARQSRRPYVEEPHSDTETLPKRPIRIKRQSVSQGYDVEYPREVQRDDSARRTGAKRTPQETSRQASRQPSHERKSPPVKPARPVTEQVKPVMDPVKPVTEPVKPVTEPVKPVTEPVKPVAAKNEKNEARAAIPDLVTPSESTGQPASVEDADEEGNCIPGTRRYAISEASSARQDSGESTEKDDHSPGDGDSSDSQTSVSEYLKTSDAEPKAGVFERPRRPYQNNTSKSTNDLPKAKLTQDDLDKAAHFVERPQRKVRTRRSTDDLLGKTPPYINRLRQMPISNHYDQGQALDSDAESDDSHLAMSGRPVKRDGAGRRNRVPPPTRTSREPAISAGGMKREDRMFGNSSREPETIGNFSRYESAPDNDYHARKFPGPTPTPRPRVHPYYYGHAMPARPGSRPHLRGPNNNGF